MKNLINSLMMKGYMKTFLKVFVVVMIVFTGIAYIVLNTLNVMSFDSDSQLHINLDKIFEREAQNINVELMNINYKYAQTYGSSSLVKKLDDGYGNFDNIEEFYNDKENIKNIELQLQYVPTLEEVIPYAQKKESILTEAPKYSYARRFAKEMALYAKYLALQGEFEKSAEVLKNMASISLIVALGSTGKTTTIDYMIGMAVNKILNDSVEDILNKNYEDLPKEIIRVTDIPENYKNKLAEIVKIMDENFPELREIAEGEKYIMVKAMAALYENYPVNMFIVDFFTTRPFSNTKKLFAEFYDTMTEYIEAGKIDKFDEEVGYKFHNSKNPLVASATIRVTRIGSETDKLKEQNKRILKAITASK